jgi:hypothetical protein
MLGRFGFSARRSWRSGDQGIDPSGHHLRVSLSVRQSNRASQPLIRCGRITVLEGKWQRGREAAGRDPSEFSTKPIVVPDECSTTTARQKPFALCCDKESMPAQKGVGLSTELGVMQRQQSAYPREFLVAQQPLPKPTKPAKGGFCLFRRVWRSVYSRDFGKIDVGEFSIKSLPRPREGRPSYCRPNSGWVVCGLNRVRYWFAGKLPPAARPRVWVRTHQRR